MSIADSQLSSRSPAETRGREYSTPAFALTKRAQLRYSEPRAEICSGLSSPLPTAKSVANYFPIETVLTLSDVMNTFANIPAK